MKNKFLKVALFLVISLLSFMYTIKWLNSINLSFKTDSLIQNSNSITSNNTLIENVVDYIVKLDLFNPTDMLSSNYIGLVSIEKKEKEVPLFISRGKNENNSSPIIVEDVNVKEPIIYIYNTHYEEKYAQNDGKDVSVRDAANILKDRLSKYNIESVVEKTNPQDILRANNWSYGYSYVVSKMLMEQAKKDYSSLNYYIDIHRDSLSKSLSTAVINDKSYAKVMFLVGLENKNYKANKAFMTNINNKLKSEYPGISRGLYEKEGPTVNGVYNQDFSGNCILIEIGGEHNTLEEITNTVEAFSKVLNDYIGGINGEA